ncbi:hypothetical protein BCR33DRAFT_788506 [Rhizoclosmatium globosum]|uniref:TLC domain-containing protein n=1 Tax=Rhizoclosmatium globosum TaxID=329046 RepID=A0A1Y2BWP0_9FUNG|nr:hypothetical protein BCR33DRAFT_788506 [Rhizoclosmatium globosum]|eukprot:ORY39067.1 hypothetical protein BCR33DRAFT_788506 [Rhizoclosmatium globosum]
MSQEIQAVNIPDFMDVKLIFALIGVSFAPVLLLAQTIVVNILPHLASFKKPTKLVFHLFHAIPELLSFLLLWAFYIIPVLRNIVGNETFPAYDNPGFTFKVIIAVDYYYVMAYTVELLFNYSVMQTMLIIHHTTAIVITLTASYLILATTDNLLLTEYIMLSGTSAVLHASVDFIPHFYLILRQFKAPQTLTRFFGMVSIWPLTIFRLAVNIFFVVIVRYFVTTVFRELTPIFYGWTIFTSVMTAVLAVTQYWAHGVYVKIQKKDQRREGTTASQEYELDKVRASITSLGSTDV